MDLNVYGEVDSCFIGNRIIDFKAKFRPGVQYYLVMKNNFYGLGEKIVNYIEETIDGIVLCDWDDLVRFLNVNPLFTKNIILLYPDLSMLFKYQDIVRKRSVYLVCMDVEELERINAFKMHQNTYIRLDPFLGGHGLNIMELKGIQQVEQYKGLLLHINEFLDFNETRLLAELGQWANEHNMAINIGGSSILRHEHDLEIMNNLEIRFVKDAIIDTELCSSLNLFTRIIHKKKIVSPISIGYKSSRVKLDKGTLLTLSIGYGLFKLLTDIYQHQIKISIQGFDFVLPCYPCMNTCWIYNDEDVDISSDYINLFEDQRLIHTIAKTLDIDQDEVLTSLSSMQIKYK